jgi:hypothetical protein
MYLTDALIYHLSNAGENEHYTVHTSVNPLARMNTDR